MKLFMQNFINKFYQAIIVTLLAIVLIVSVFGGVQTWRASAWKTDYQLLDAKYKTEVAEEKAATEKAKAEAREQEKIWVEQLLQAEKNYSESLKDIIADSNSAKSLVERMSKQIDTATSRMSTATKETIIEYANTNSDILKECIGKYQYVAEQADKHAIDAKRLSDAWLQEKALK